MPRPRHPIREHFHEILGSERKNGAVSCNYCNKEQSAGNPKRCQKHLDECTQYAQVLAAIDAGEPNALPFNSPYDSPQQQQQQQHAQHQGFPGSGLEALQSPQVSTPSNNFPTTPAHNSQGIGVPGGSLTEGAIMRALRINDSLYLAIERELDAQLNQLNISGAGLHTPSGRQLLKQAFYAVHQRFPEVFNEIPESEKTQALQSMANICNRKRRNGAPPSAGSVTPGSGGRKQQLPGQSALRFVSMPVDTTNGPLAHSSPQQPRAQAQMQAQAPVSTSSGQLFGQSTIIAERADGSGAFCVCRPSDLIDEDKAADDITVDDVRFEPFVDLLQRDDDVMFNSEVDKIMYTFTGGRIKSVSNEIVWRVALEEMHRKGLDPYVFRIFKRQ